MTGNSDEQTPGAGRTRLDTTGEFFSVGTPLHAVRAGYVRRAADDVLYETVVAGRYAHVIAPDRSGKSSLVAATTARLENHGFKVATLDLEQIGVRDAGTDEGRWYYSVAYRLLRQLRIRADLQSWWQDKSILNNQQRLVEFYSEIILQNVQERVVIFVDEIQCVESLAFADQLLASIRAAHNARATDPEFSRLTFVLLGECDPLSLIDEPELSPFNVTQPVTLGDFSRADLDLFAAELNLSPQNAIVALDRIYYWTSGQPYLSQKLARAVSREQILGDVAENVDRIALQQLAGRAALRSEPAMSHIHRAIVSDQKRKEGLLTLYGRLCKGVEVDTDLGSPLQRRLIAVGLIKIDEEGKLRVRNRLYESVFTARWANENLPTRWRTPLMAAAVILLIVALPFWYTQLLPRGYVSVLTSHTVELSAAEDAYINLRSFPGHADAADQLYRSFVTSRARRADDEAEVNVIAEMASALPGAGRLPDEILAAYWDRRVREAMRTERRDEALIGTLQSLTLSTPQRRKQAASLVADDYPLLIASLRDDNVGSVIFDPHSMTLTESRAAEVLQWSLEPQGLARREAWSMTALEVAPLVRRVVVDRQGEVRRASLTINLSHARVRDLRIKVIAPSGRAVEVDPGVERASSNQDLRIPAAQLADLVGEPISGTWSLSVRDEELGVAGQLVGWNLNLNSQGLVEEFQRGLNIADPAERETDNVWFSGDGRYAVTRAMQSDSARVWDLAFARPVRAVAVNELEQLIGLSTGARLLVTATQDTVNLWDTATGHRMATLPVGAGSSSSLLTDDGNHLLVQRRSDIDTTIELWSLDTAGVTAKISVAGTPALVSLDSSSNRLAIADYDRAVRVWDLRDGSMVAQIDLEAQPSRIELAAGGAVLGVVFRQEGVSLWRLDRPQDPLLREFEAGRWQLAFSPSGTRALIGTGREGFQVYDTSDGRALGPLLGSGGRTGAESLLAFSADEQIIVTGGADSVARFWRAPALPAQNDVTSTQSGHTIWPPSGDAVAIATPDAATAVVGDRRGDVHFLATDASQTGLQVEADEISYLGHNSEVRLLVASADGSTVASAALDNTVRIWSTATGLPSPFFIDVPGEAVEKMVFSPDGSLVGVLNGRTAQIVDAATGELVARFDLGERQGGLAFATSNRLYTGGESGALRAIVRDSAGSWSVQNLWKGDSAIQWLEASPRGRYLVLVDRNNLALLFDLEDGQIGEEVLQLPSAVRDVVFVPGGSRVLFRTTGWIHRASSSATGLLWIDAMLAPRAIGGARIVFGDEAGDAAAQSGSRLYLPIAGDGFMRLAEFYFSAEQWPALFGNRIQLLEEWRRRLGLSVVAPQGTDEQLQTSRGHVPGGHGLADSNVNARE